ncbi:hypothetical protein KEM48_010847 [Puccinia striiformis f. sp. tritici PST-130]|nr:hypothetical protein KEM48_010847 [Puccinia striiformis f. sp. tritici PST-130]
MIKDHRTSKTNCSDSLVRAVVGQILSNEFSNPGPVGCWTHRTRLVRRLLGPGCLSNYSCLKLLQKFQKASRV